MTMLRTDLVLVVWCVLLVYTTAYSYKRQGQEGLTCEDVIKEMEGEPLPQDYEGPSCDESGNYKAVQCYGIWTGRGYCMCVDPITGERFADIKGVEYYSIMMNGGHMTCQCALDNSDRATYCDQQTGDYLPVVCIGDRCRCAERWGPPMYDYNEFNKGESNCLCARRNSDQGITPGQTVNCNHVGQFETVQCTGSMCFCVDKEGTQIGDPVPREDAQNLKC